jgi:tellurite resistance protein TerA
MQSLRMGANAPLNTSRFEVIIEWPATAGTLDSSVYLLAADGKVRGDDDMIFYNQRSHPTGAVEITRIEHGRTDITVDVGAVPADIHRIAICVTIEERGRTMAAFDRTSAMVRSNGEGQLQFVPELGGAREAALRLVEIYRRNDAWKLRADGQGFNDGLAPLARSFGIDVADDEAAPPRDATIPFPPQQQVPASPRVMQPDLVHAATASTTLPVLDMLPAPVPSPRGPDDGAVRLGPGTDAPRWKTGLEDRLGAMSAKLTWSSQCGGIEGRPRPLELALGCLYELRDGRRGAVQSWDYNGQYDTAPFLQLLSIEAAGLSGSQKLRINGERWSKISRLALYGFIPAGAPSWRSSALSLEISATNRDRLRLELNEGVEGCGLVALLLIENQEEEVAFTRLARFLPGHHELDAELGWGLTWSVRAGDRR